MHDHDSYSRSAALEITCKVLVNISTKWFLMDCDAENIALVNSPVASVWVLIKATAIAGFQNRLKN